MINHTPDPGRPREGASRWRGLALPALLSALALPLIFLDLGSYGVVNGDEAYYHYVARRMVRTGDWLRLEFAGEFRAYETFTHAPLFLWAKAVLIAAFGDSYWTMRGISAGCAWLSILATYRLAGHLAGERAGLLAGLLQLTTFQFLYLHCARTGEMEPAISLLFTLSAYTLIRSLESGRGFVAHHLCLVALLNLKLGLVVIPPLAACAVFALRREARPRFRTWLVQGVLIVPLGLAWHVYQAVHLWEPFLETLRMMRDQASGSEPGHLGSVLANLRYYASNVYFGSFPHVLVYPLALIGLLRAPAPEERWPWRVLGAYMLAIAAFVTLVDLHHSWYVIPLYPFLSCFAGAWLERLGRRPPALVLATATLVLAIGAWTRFAIFAIDPFSTRATRTVEQWHWAQLGPLGPTLGIPLCAVGVGLVLAAIARSLPPPRRARILATTLIAGLLGLGALRALAPLRFTSHVSSAERLYVALEQAKARGEPIDYPIRVKDWGIMKIRYFFADEYDLRFSPGSPDGRKSSEYVLHGPAVAGAPRQSYPGDE